MVKIFQAIEGNQRKNIEDHPDFKSRIMQHIYPRDRDHKYVSAISKPYVMLRSVALWISLLLLVFYDEIQQLIRNGMCPLLRSGGIIFTQH